jgi:hypothetical protein
MALDPPSNVLLRIEDEALLKDNEEAKIKGPRARKSTEKPVTTKPGTFRRWIGLKSGPVLCDFVEAQTEEFIYRANAAAYRAPEVFLHLACAYRGCLEFWLLGLCGHSFLSSQVIY